MTGLLVARRMSLVVERPATSHKRHATSDTQQATHGVQMATQSIQLKAEPRSALGSRANKRLRDKGFIPGVIYGHKEAVVPVTLPKRELSNHLSRGAHVFELAIDGKSEQVLVKDVQYDHFGSEVIHVDFARVSLDERVTVT